MSASQRSRDIAVAARTTTATPAATTTIQPSLPSSVPLMVTTPSTFAHGRKCLPTSGSGSLPRGGGSSGGSLDLREPDHRDRVLFGHLTVVELAQEVRHFLGTADLRVVVLDLPRRQLAQRLHLDLVDHCLEDPLARAESCSREDLDDHPLLVLGRLVTQSDRCGLPKRSQLVGDDRGIEVERVHGVDHKWSSASAAMAFSAISFSPLYASSRGASSSGSQRTSAISWACSGGTLPILPEL